jgi:hypothetical protein
MAKRRDSIGSSERPTSCNSAGDNGTGNLRLLDFEVVGYTIERIVEVTTLQAWMLKLPRILPFTRAADL